MKTQQTSQVSVAEVYFGIAALAGMSAFGGYTLLSKPGMTTKREASRAADVRQTPQDEFSKLAAPQRDLRKEFFSQVKE